MELAIKTSRIVVLIGLLTSLYAALLGLIYWLGRADMFSGDEGRNFGWEWKLRVLKQALPFILSPVFFFAARKLKGGLVSGVTGILAGVLLVFWMNLEADEVVYQLLYIAGMWGVFFGFSVLALMFLIPATLVLPTPVSIWSVMGRQA